MTGVEITRREILEEVRPELSPKRCSGIKFMAEMS